MSPSVEYTHPEPDERGKSMLYLGSPTESDINWVNVPEDTYELIVASIDVVPNQFYTPDQPAKRKEQLEWKFVIRKSEIEALPALEGEDKRYSTSVRFWSPTYFSRDRRNRFALVCKNVDPDFDLDRDPVYEDFDDVKAHVLEHGVRGILKENEKTGYMYIDGFLKSKLPPVTLTDLLESGVIKVDEQVNA